MDWSIALGLNDDDMVKQDGFSCGLGFLYLLVSSYAGVPAVIFAPMEWRSYKIGWPAYLLIAWAVFVVINIILCSLVICHSKDEKKRETACFKYGQCSSAWQFLVGSSMSYGLVVCCV